MTPDRLKNLYWLAVKSEIDERSPAVLEACRIAKEAIKRQLGATIQIRFDNNFNRI